MRFRLAVAANLAECRAMLHPGFRLTGYADDRLPGLWERLFENDRAAFVVVDDPGQPWPRSLAGFLTSVFVSDAFVEELLRGREPCLAAAIYDRMLAGRSPVLTPAEIRAANSTHGLNLVLLHLGVRGSELSEARSVRALRQIGAGLYFFRAGYRLSVVLGEAFGRRQASFMEAAGLRPLVDSTLDSRSVKADPDRFPYLFIARKEWNEPAELGQISTLFHAPAARLGLSRAEQRAVLGALLGQTDLEIAMVEGVSVDAVKKAWRRIHERMASSIPYLEDPARVHPESDRRSSEKRRHLVEYLRYHPEELRPMNRQETNGRSRALGYLE